MTDDHEVLNRYLDDLVTGKQPRSDGLEPELVSTVHRLHELSATRVPPPSFVDRLEESIMQSGSFAAAPPSSITYQSLPPGRRSGAALKHHGSIRPGWARWLPAVVSAVLVLVTLGIGAGQFGWGRDDPGRRPGGVAILAPSTPSPAAGNGVLLEFPLPADALPDDGIGMAGVRYFTMAPGTSTSWDGPQYGSLNPGYWIDYLLEGSMSMTAEGAADVIRADGTSESVPVGTTITLQPGDTVIHRVEESKEWTNPGPTEVHIVSILVLLDQFVTYPRPSGWVETGYHTDWNEPLPAGQWVVRLEERELESNESIPAPTKPTVHYAVAEPGTLAYMSEGSADQLTLRVAEEITTVYVFTLEWTGDGTATPST